MPLLLGGVVLVLLALLSLSASEGEEGRKNAIHTALGALVVSALCLVFVRAGVPWLAGIVLLASFGRRFLANRASERAAQRSSATPAPVPSGRMSREEARAILGVAEDASRETILEAYRRLMKKLHPDLGGSTYLAQRINQARDVLVD